jgi:hypothetical protein
MALLHFTLGAFLFWAQGFRSNSKNPLHSCVVANVLINNAASRSGLCLIKPCSDPSSEKLTAQARYYLSDVYCTKVFQRNDHDPRYTQNTTKEHSVMGRWRVPHG